MEDDEIAGSAAVIWISLQERGLRSQVPRREGGWGRRYFARPGGREMGGRGVCRYMSFAGMPLYGDDASGAIW